MRLIFEKDTSTADTDLMIYFAEGRLTVQIRTLSEDGESCHFEMVWQGEVGTVSEMLAGLIEVEYSGHPLIRFEDIAVIREGLIKATSDSLRIEQQTMNLSIVAGLA